ncbi:MAG: FliM/FliN family flagellar motor switch protein [Pseudomonadota bacterium]
MTTADKSADGGGVLAKKVQSASFDVSAYPKLENLAADAGKFCSSCLSVAANLFIPPADIDSGMQSMQAALESIPENATAYWFGDPADDHALLVSLSSPFVTGLSEAFLGGAFAPPEEAQAPTSLDSELAQLFANEIATGVNKFLITTLSDVRAGNLTLKSSTTSQKAIFKDGMTSALFKLDVTFKLETGELKSALALYFPIEFLERRGLLTQTRKSVVAQNQNTKWFADMLDNIHHTEIELPVILTKYKMTLSELTRLSVDQVISLEEDAHNTLDITLKTDDGVVTLCKGKLGTFKKNKAAKVVSDIGVA